MRLSPVLEGLRVYPFVRLTEAKRRLEAEGVDVIDFGIGEPREETPQFIRDALRAEPRSGYPLAEGIPELREAVAGWCSRRFGVTLDPHAEVIPTLGSKEAIFHLAQIVGGDLVAIPSPAYPVYERGARFAGKEVVEFPLRGGRPDFSGLPWERIGLLWLNYPNNPTAAVAWIELYEEAAAIARQHDVLLASDEAYSELYFGAEPPASALQVADRTNVVALNTLSKRSAMPGFRSGFVAGDPAVIGALRRYRPNVGVAPQEFVQRAAVLAWGDEAHVEAMRAVYREKRDVLIPALEAIGLRNAGGDATMFLWLEDPHDRASELLELGIVLAPGEFFGEHGRGFSRLALVPELEACRRAAEIISRMAPR